MAQISLQFSGLVESQDLLMDFAVYCMFESSATINPNCAIETFIEFASTKTVCLEWIRSYMNRLNGFHRMLLGYTDSVYCTVYIMLKQAQ